MRYSKNVQDTKHEVPFLVLGVWSECEDCNSEPSSASRSFNTLGPARRVAEKPFLIVTGKGSLHLFINSLTCVTYLRFRSRSTFKTKFKVSSMYCITGTIGTASDTQLLRDYAVYIANLFFLTSDTVASVVKDVDLTTVTSGNLLRSF